MKEGVHVCMPISGRIAYNRPSPDWRVCLWASICLRKPHFDEVIGMSNVEAAYKIR